MVDLGLERADQPDVGAHKNPLKEGASVWIINTVQN